MKQRDLTKEKVIQTAISIANELRSTRSLSLKILAERLNIRPPSLYNHIKNQQDLLYWMAVEINQTLLDETQAALSGKFGEEALRAFAETYRRVALRNPGCISLLIQSPPNDGDQLDRIGTAMVNTISLILQSFGLNEVDTIHAIRAFRSGIFGFISLEISQGFQLKVDREESYQMMIDLMINGLPEKG